MASTRTGNSTALSVGLSSGVFHDNSLLISAYFLSVFFGLCGNTSIIIAHIVGRRRGASGESGYLLPHIAVVNVVYIFAVTLDIATAIIAKV